MINPVPRYPYSPVVMTLALLVAFEAAARDPLKAAPRRVAAVEPTSVIDATSTQSASEKASSDFLLRLGGFVGNGASSQGSTLAVGASMDIQAERYYGMDLHVFYAMTLASKGAIPGKSDQSGGLFNLKVQYPFQAIGVRWTPKLGAGIGSYHGGTEAFKGQFAVLGVEGETGPIAVHADAYQAIGGSVALTDTAGVESAYAGTQFQQYRLGGYYRLTPQVRMGVDLVHSRWANVTRDQILFPVQFDF